MHLDRHRSLSWAFNQFTNRSLQGVSYRLNSGLAKPSRFIFCLTLRCNIRCRHCGIWRAAKEEELTTGEWKNVIVSLRRWVGPYRIQFGGGETFMREDLIELINFASEKEILTGVVTNGMLIDKNMARAVTDSGLGYVHVSIDGIKPQTHDYIRGVEGTHEKAVRAVEYLNDANSGLAIFVAAVITGYNLDELVDLVKWTEDRNLKGIVFNPLGPTLDSDPDWYNKTNLWFDNFEKLDSVIDELIRMKKAGRKIVNPVDQFLNMKSYFRNPGAPRGGRCMVGITNIGITCDGYIHTCFKMPSLGNVKEISPRKAWASEEAREVRKKIKDCTIHCSPGNYIYRRNLLSEIVRYIKFG